MKKAVLFLLFVATILSATPAYCDIEFQIANNSGVTWTEIWVGPSSNTKWLDRDRTMRGESTLRSGRYTTIKLSSVGRENVQYWDIRVDYGNNKHKEWHEIDMYSDIYQIVIDKNWKHHFQR